MSSSDAGPKDELDGAFGPPTDPVDGVEAQLVSLYRDRELLHRELGTADPDEIVRMVRSLEAQLVDLYREKAQAFAERSAAGADRRDER
ncbi:MAG: hypothetical protein ACFCGT_03595 [Sandaracinaceae bacterium]